MESSPSSRVSLFQRGEYLVPAKIARKVAASYLVALTSAQDKQEAVTAALARKALESISAKYTKQVEALWDEANKTALDLLVQVLKNNPGKSPQEVARRPDVAAALREPYEDAAKASEDILRAAWAASVDDTTKRLKSEFVLMGAKWEGAEPDVTMLDSLVGDLHKNAKAIRARYLAALSSVDREKFAEKAKTVANDATRRASFSTSVAVWGASSAVRDDAYAKAGLNKMWMSKGDSQTCTNCKKLHGTVMGPKEQFPVPKDYTVYGGVLYGPPLHPRCRCVSVGTKKQKSKFS